MLGKLVNFFNIPEQCGTCQCSYLSYLFDFIALAVALLIQYLCCSDFVMSLFRYVALFERLPFEKVF